MMNKLDELEKLAKAATPGPWEYHEEHRDPVDACGYGEVVPLNGVTGWALDLEYIAAANPEAVLLLIDEIRTTNNVLEVLREEIAFLEARNERLNAVARAAEGVLHKADTAGVSHKMFGENTPAYVKPLRQALAALEEPDD